MSERSGMFRLFYRKGGDRSTAALMHDNRAALRDLVEAFDPAHIADRVIRHLQQD